ncbi:MAG: hypothetical protein ABIN18_17670 [Pseudomonadota bacterium]
MQKIIGHLEGLILLVLGFYMGALVTVGGSWRYMNPKFEWLTAAAAIMFIITGGIAVLRPNRRANLSGIVIFLVFIGVAAMGTSTALQSPPLQPGIMIDESDQDSSRLTLNGIEYIKINLAEIYQHCLNGEADKIAGRYLARGIVKRTPALDSSGQFAIIRTAVICCLAHAAPVGFRVHYSEADEFNDGQWVKVYGSLKTLPSDLPNPELHIRGLFFTRLNKSYGIVPTKIVKIPEPAVPYIFDFKSAEPYAY